MALRSRIQVIGASSWRGLVAAAVLLFVASAAQATPVSYGFVSGSAMLDIEVNGSPISSLSAPVTGTFFTFDAMVPALTDLEIVIDDTIDLGLLLGTLDISVVVTDGAGFSAPAGGTGPWTWTGGPFDIAADVTLSGGLAGGFSQLINVSSPSAGGTVDVSGSSGTLHAVRSSMFTFLHGGQTVEVFATIDFVGVPEPALGALILIGMGALRLRRV